ncbi:Mitochondrial substrate/solute carrier [Trypanosoma melophagium]|uniref:Mitochondrial substrate/solute carrier n=1 Tax=Trypanosoma melophagium TaxID=715481 RepID=UPI003519E248|nr:Mitochondrial substrate/solute carrier [Trypanosoma melophagium]
MSEKQNVEAGIPQHQPDDPEYYLEEVAQQNADSDLSSIPVSIGINMAYLITVNTLQAPVNRVFLLQCVEGKLIQNGRLPTGGFGGIRGCIYYIVRKEGFLGLFRGCLTDMIYSSVSYIAQVLVATGISQVQQRLIPVSWTAAVLWGVAAPGLRLLITAPIVEYKNNAMCNYVADIVAPNDSEAASEGEVEEAYLYSSAREAATAVKSRLGWKGLHIYGLDVDIASIYVQSITTQLLGFFVVPSVVRLFKQHITQPGRQVAAVITMGLGVRLLCGVIFQPFQVIRARMALLSTKELEEPKRNPWFWRYAQDIVRKDGVTALWSGLRLRFLRDMGGVLFDAALM